MIQKQAFSGEHSLECFAKSATFGPLLFCGRFHFKVRSHSDHGANFAGQRFANLRSPRRYTTIVGTDYENGAADPVSAMTSPAGPVEMVDITTPAIDVAETMMMGMRLNQGVTHERFEKRFGAAVDVIFPDEVARLTKLGLIDITKEAVLLSERGRLLGNEVFAEFIGDPDE